MHRPAARYSRIDGNFYNQAMAMYRYTHLFTSKKKRPMYVHLVLRTFIELLCCEQFKNLSRFKFNEVDQRVLFIATSDDPKWLKANLRGVNNDLYFSADLFAGKILSFQKVFVQNLIETSSRW